MFARAVAIFRDMYLVFGLSKGEWNLVIDHFRAKVCIEFPKKRLKGPLMGVFAREKALTGVSCQPSAVSFDREPGAGCQSTKTLYLLRSWGIAFSPVHLAQAEPHGSRNLN